MPPVRCRASSCAEAKSSATASDRAMHLPGDESYDVGETLELDPIDGPSALQQWTVLGLFP